MYLIYQFVLNVFPYIQLQCDQTDPHTETNTISITITNISCIASETKLKLLILVIQ